MAEGGDFAYQDEILDHLIDNDDDYDYDDDEQEVDTTRSFDPGASSTPHYGAEQYEMQPMHEQSGLPDTSYEIPLLRRAGSITDLQRESGLRQKMKRSIDMIKPNFPEQTLKL